MCHDPETDFVGARIDSKMKVSRGQTGDILLRAGAAYIK